MKKCENCGKYVDENSQSESFHLFDHLLCRECVKHVRNALTAYLYPSTVVTLPDLKDSSAEPLINLEKIFPAG